jgi:signal peptidase I
MRTLLRFLLWTMLILGLLGGLLRLTILRAWRVPNNDPVLEASLRPTMRGGDLVLLWRLTQPTFGDLVMCPEPEAPGRVVVGRIVGEAGDTVKIESGEPTINGEPFKNERMCDPRDFVTIDPDDGTEVTQQCDWEVIANRVHMRGTIGGHKPPRNYSEVDVPPGHVYLLSDNRLFPYDSRDYGPVPREGCKETAVFRLWSKDGWVDKDARFTLIR